jgi:hypothetical protein
MVKGEWWVKGRKGTGWLDLITVSPFFSSDDASREALGFSCPFTFVQRLAFGISPIIFFSFVYYLDTKHSYRYSRIVRLGLQRSYHFPHGLGQYGGLNDCRLLKIPALLRHSDTYDGITYSFR